MVEGAYRRLVMTPQDRPHNPESSRVLAMKPRVSSLAMRLGWALALCFIMITAILVYTTNRLREELAGTREQVKTVSSDLESEKRWAAVVTAPGARAASFSLTPDAAAELKARVTYDPSSRRAVFVFENFKAQAGRDYELWALRGTTPATLGLIRADQSGHAVLRLEDVGDPATLTAFAISLEAQGGAPAKDGPAGPIVMLAGVGG
jgi:hypothetical protein